MKTKKRRYLVRNAKALRCRIKFSPESIQWAVAKGGMPYNSDGNPNLLNVDRNDNGRRLNTNYDKPDNKWNRNNGFAFVLSQLSSFSLSTICRESFVVAYEALVE